MATRPRPVRFRRADREAFLSALSKKPLADSEAHWAIEQIGQALADYRQHVRKDTHKKPPKEDVRKRVERVRRDAANLIEALKALDAESERWLATAVNLELGRVAVPVGPGKLAFLFRVGTDLILLRDGATKCGLLLKQGLYKRGGPRPDDAATFLAAVLAVIWRQAAGKWPTLTVDGPYLGFVHAVFTRGGVESGHERAAARGFQLLLELPKS